MGKQLNRNAARKEAVCLEMASKRPLRGGSLPFTAWFGSKLRYFCACTLEFFLTGCRPDPSPADSALSWAELVAVGRMGTVHPCSYHAVEVPV